LSSQITGRNRAATWRRAQLQVRLGEVYDSRLGDESEPSTPTHRAGARCAHSGALEALARLLQSENRLAGGAEVLDQFAERSSVSKPSRGRSS